MILALFHLGPKCEIVEECSVPCEHGTCPSKADVCECETNWGPPGDCSVYNGPCSNCSSKGGKCKTGPNKCDCNPGLSSSNNHIYHIFIIKFLYNARSHWFKQRAL